MTSPSTTHPPYRLAAHVRACRIDEQVILLDMRRNKYIGVGGQKLPSIAAAVADWPTSPPLDTGTKASAESILDPLIEQGLLVPSIEGIAPPAIIGTATASMPAGTRFDKPALELRRFANLCTSAAVVSYWLKRRCLADIAGTVASLRQEREAAHKHAETSTAVAAYLRLRPFVLTAHDQCLLDSLTMVRYLSREGLFPRWVIGVRTRPFSAHSWVQSGGLVLNDLHENVRAFTPILVV